MSAWLFNGQIFTGASPFNNDKRSLPLMNRVAPKRPEEFAARLNPELQALVDATGLKNLVETFRSRQNRPKSPKLKHLF